MEKVYWILLVSIILCSCGLRKNSYVAPLPNTPKFTKAGETYFNSSASPTHIEFQGGLSLTKNIGVIAGRFYGGTHRWSNELGVNLFAPIYEKLYFSTTIGWGETQLGYSYTHPLFSTENSSISVNYQSKFIQPGIYFVSDIEENKLRLGVFLKYSINQLNAYYYREYENEFHRTSLIKESIYTAPSQSFTSFSPTFSLEVAQGVFNMGAHYGYTLTSDIKGSYTFNHFKSPRLSEQYSTDLKFNHFPLILSVFIGIRI